MNGGSGSSGAGWEEAGTGIARTVDRIAEPWGSRTPYGAGEFWPVRIDAFLEEGVSEEDVDRWVQSASILHSNGDAMDIAVKDGRMVGVRGHVPSRVNHGRLDPKDLFGWQANGSPDRLTKPLVRKRRGSRRVGLRLGRRKLGTDRRGEREGR